jgi:chorismate synthase
VFKPTASNRKTLEAIKLEAKGEEHPKSPQAFSGIPLRQEVTGRHDACVAVRAVPVVEAMAALVLAEWHDFCKQQ